MENLRWSALCDSLGSHTEISLYFSVFHWTSLHFFEFLCISLHFFALLYISLCFSGFLFISLHFTAFVNSCMIPILNFLHNKRSWCRPSASSCSSLLTYLSCSNTLQQERRHCQTSRHAILDNVQWTCLSFCGFVWYRDTAGEREFLRTRVMISSRIVFFYDTSLWRCSGDSSDLK